ncbi:hypothetical protein HK101_000308, partial [Irineochytrium annulatum]
MDFPWFSQHRDIGINLPLNGVCLRFDALTQRLRLIEVFDFDRIVLGYNGAEFNSKKVLPTFLLIHKLFGPIHPGKFEKRKYILNYPGVSFVFPFPEHGAKPSSDGINDLMPLLLDDGTTPLASSCYIYASTANGGGELETDTQAAQALESINVYVGRGLFFTKRSCFVPFGASTQDVLAELGYPSQSVLREDGKSAAGGGFGAGGSGSAAMQDFIFNYFALGLDVFFDGETHTVKKFTFHTNLPSHYDFNRWNNRQWKLDSDSSHTGCLVDPGNPRTFSHQFPGSGYTFETCSSSAAAAGYTYFGLEYGGECWGDTAIRGNAGTAPASDCSFPCNGNKAQICGAGNRLSAYFFGAPPTSTSTTTVAPTTTAPPATSAAPASTTSTTAAAASGWNSIGCMVDSGNPHTFAHQFPGSTYTFETCSSNAAAAGYTYFGLEYGGECWADTAIRGNAAKAPASDCSFPCNGNPAQLCGAGSRLSAYFFG